MKFARITLLAASLALAGALVASPVVAQKAPAAPKKTTKAKAKTKTGKKEATPKTTTRTTTRRSAAKSASKKKAPSVCAGLTQSRCKANKVCGWIKPKKAVSKNGRKLTPYCRKVAGIAKKKPKAKAK